MSKITNRDTPPRSAELRLARLLDTPYLARVVPHLPPETLHQIIRYRGLEACGELVTSATPAQMTSLLDLDLWRHRQPGRDEQFDVDRFGEWLEVLVEAGDSIAARTVAAVDPELVVAGLSRYVLVLDPAIFEPTAPTDDEPGIRYESTPDGDTDNWPECAVGGYLVRPRRADAWDAIVALLIALDAGHGDYFHAVMQGCRRLSNPRPEIDGLDALLPPPEQQLLDITIERERRRSEQGYATPADARAFLEMARQPPHTRAGAATLNPLVTAYFRAADAAPEPSRETVGPVPREDPDDAPETLEAVMDLLAEAGVMPERPRALLGGADADPQAPKLTRLRRLVAYVRDADETAYFTRSRELAFLANTLLAGCTVQSRPFTPQEASDAAAAVCNLGLEYWPARWPGTSAPSASSTSGRDSDTPPDSFLVEHDLVTAFEVGWSVLHEEVSLFAADQLVATLKEVETDDRDIRRGLVALRRTLVKQRHAPWRAREAAEVLALLDMTASIGVLGLLDECPVLPATLTAIVEGRTTAVSATAFEFISTAAQIGEVRLFMRKLPDLLSA